MRKIMKWAPVIYAAYLLAESAIWMILFDQGYSFTISSEPLWFATRMIIAGAFTALCLCQRKSTAKPAVYIAQLLPLVALFHIIQTRSAETGPVALAIIQSLLYFLSAFVISLLYENPLPLKIISGVINSLLLAGLLLLCFAIVIFGSIGESEVIRRVASPDQTREAVLLSYDEGAMGGSTLVNVRDNTATIDLGLVRWEKWKGLYDGQWGEFDAINLAWKDDHTLLIDQEAYPVD